MGVSVSECVRVYVCISWLNVAFGIFEALPGWVSAP